MRMQFNHNVASDLRRRRKEFIAGISRRDNVDTFRHIAILINKNGAIISVGHNNVRPNKFSTIHAERDAIEKAIRKYTIKYGRTRLQKAPPEVELAVMRDNATNSRPCFNCITDVIGKTTAFNITRVSYTHENSNTMDGLIETTPTKLYNSRYEHVSRFNARRMGLDTLDALAGTEDNNCHSHCHTEECLGLSEDESADEEGKDGLGT